MSPRAFLTPRSYLLKRYLSSVARNLRNGEKQSRYTFSGFFIGSSPTAITSRKNLEYWTNHEPFLSTGRTFARIDTAIAYRAGEKSLLALNGWIIDLDDAINSLSFHIQDSHSTTVVLKKKRPDVVQAFPGQRHALRSGFSALIPDVRHETALSKVQFSYTTVQGTHIRFDLPLNRISRSIIGPDSEPSHLPELSENPAFVDLLVFGPIEDGRAHDPLRIVFQTCKTLKKTIAVICRKDIESSVLEIAEGAPFLSQIVPVDSHSEAAAALTHWRGRYKTLLFIDDMNAKIVSEAVPSVAAVPRIPPIANVLSVPLQTLPVGLHGDLISFIRWPAPGFQTKITSFLEEASESA